MKLTKKAVALFLAALMIITCACVTGLTASATGSTLASQYKTNSVGVGSKKSITVDGAITDWESSMLIAQGAANDAPPCLLR